MKLIAAFVVVAALVLAYAAGYKTADRRCVSAPVGPSGTIATWCTADWPTPSTF
jgi:hypothetical protein